MFLCASETISKCQYIPVFVCPSICRFKCVLLVSVFFSVCLSQFWRTPVFVCSITCVLQHLYVSVSVCLSVCPSGCVSVCAPYFLVPDCCSDCIPQCFCVSKCLCVSGAVSQCLYTQVTVCLNVYVSQCLRTPISVKSQFMYLPDYAPVSVLK